MKTVVKWLQHEWNYSVFLADYASMRDEDATWFERNAPRKLVALYFVASNCVQHLRSAILCRKGHDYIDRSDASCAESGRFDMECSRCGKTLGGYW